MLKTLVIIPVYNESQNIVKTIEDLKKYQPDIDYIIVNDGSTDCTLEILEDNHFHYINSLQNLGLFGAVETGFKWACLNHYQVAIQFDGDGQHSAKYINELIKGIEEGYDIVIGSRYLAKKKPWNGRMAGSRLISAAIKLVTKKTIHDPTSGFRAYNETCIKLYANGSNNPPEPDTLVYMLNYGKLIKEVQVEMHEREYGKSYLNIMNALKYMCRMIISILFIQPFRRGK